MTALTTKPQFSRELNVLAMWTDGVLEFDRPWANAWIWVDPGGWHSRLPWPNSACILD